MNEQQIEQLHVLLENSKPGNLVIEKVTYEDGVLTTIYTMKKWRYTDTVDNEGNITTSHEEIK